ncbi:methylenetetrahydrofolate reductase [NAD(P)H] [Bifidobacterium choloepi]|uniref:Methylenetetrahydrofolate reductase n=1 Tax=Bifidobacterium choloepi TaxID=2614131 RepID=A0A6I5MY36_9BIFI|nr:methylenetetrahydrofolate reductase [NAD(P)H] [Bifidobacterium choloepi]NEG69177.1 methylenetetrahydrofolate reductase [NAD(P)H] [Bifidobacterium choloepi]
MTAPLFSLEVFPPRRNASIGTIYDTLDGLQGLSPAFISVTYGTGRKTDKTATARIANTIRTEYGIDAVAHLTAVYLSKADVDEALGLFDEAKVSGVLALRGDRDTERPPVGDFRHATDLVAYIRERRPDLKIYGACYPEKHPEVETMAEDVRHLREKVDAGCSHLVSQLFYDNDDFYRFLEMTDAAGIDVPIEAGVMPVMNPKSVVNMSTKCGSSLPPAVRRMLERWGDDRESLRAAGVCYASEQIADLVANGVDGVHLYTMNHPSVTRRIWSNVRPLFS